MNLGNMRHRSSQGEVTTKEAVQVPNNSNRAHAKYAIKVKGQQNSQGKEHFRKNNELAKTEGSTKN